MIERLYQNYKNEVVTVLQNKFNYKNVMEIPKIVKVVINMGSGRGSKRFKENRNCPKRISLQ